MAYLPELHRCCECTEDLGVDNGDGICSECENKIYPADDRAPTIILQCPACAQHIPFYGDDTDATDTFTLGVDELAVCECGAVFGEDDVLGVVWEDGAPTASDTHAELARLRARVAELEQRIAAAQGIIDTNADALTGWRARDFAEAMRAALRGGAE